MRRLYILMGVSGSGKSRYIHDNHLERYTVSTDEIREMLSVGRTVGSTHDCYNDPIAYANNKLVFKLFYEILEERMRRGETVYVEATHLSKGAFKEYNKLRQMYNYDVRMIDFTAPQVRKLNYNKANVTHYFYSQTQGRPHEYMRFDYDVIKEQVNKYYVRYVGRQNNTISYKYVPQWIKVFEYDANDENKVHADEALKIQFSLKDYHTIHIIGDVHGDYENLQKIFANHTKGTGYIFVGDYLDRGNPEHLKDTLEFLTSLKGNNIVFLRGNHEQAWFDFVNYGKITRPSFQRTVDTLIKRGDYTKEELQAKLREFNKRLLPYCTIETPYSDTVCQYLIHISHAGLDNRVVRSNNTPTFEYLNEDVFVNGLAPDPYSYNVDREWNRNVDDQIINIHGHRNAFHEGIHPYSSSYNLTEDGEFRYVTLTKGSGRWLVDKAEESDDKFYLPNTPRIITHTLPSSNSTAALISELADSQDIKQKQLDDGIIANNYTKEAFREQRWNNTTVKARGLFTRANEIVGRGFTKFFNAGERPESDIKTLTYPIRVAKKVDGFLAIIFYDKELNTIKVYSKGGGEYHSHLAAYVLKYTGEFDKIDKYYEDKANRDTTLLYEIVEPVMDEHIVWYDDICATRLAAVKNDLRGSLMLVSNIMGIIHNEDELKTFLSLHTNTTEEGYVFYDANDKMVKVKSNYFRIARELRKGMELGKPLNSWKNTDDKIKKTAYEWYKKAQSMGMRTFSPKVAYDVYWAFRIEGMDEFLPTPLTLEDLTYKK